MSVLHSITAIISNQLCTLDRWTVSSATKNNVTSIRVADN